MYRNTPRSYGRVARIFHWLTALIILTNIGLGLWAVRIPLDRIALKVQVFSLHKTLGVAALTVGCLRILWALTQPRPVPVHADRRLETAVAEIAHWVLYGALVLVPLTGWIEHAATQGYAPILWPFGQDLPLVPKSAVLAATMAMIHHVFAWLLIGTIVLHVSGALKHTLIDRDGVLARMLTGARSGGRRHAAGHALPAAIAIAIFGAGAAYALVTTRPERPTKAAALEQAASDWTVTDESMGFAIRQMGTEVRGGFSDWTAAIAFDPETGTGNVRVAINTDSVTIGTVTDQAKGADFFDTAAHPTAVYQANIRPEGDSFIADGTLSLKGQDVPLRLPFTLQITDGIAQMAGTVTMDRRDWSIGTSYPDEATVGFGVDLDVSLRAYR